MNYSELRGAQLFLEKRAMEKRAGLGRYLQNIADRKFGKILDLANEGSLTSRQHIKNVLGSDLDNLDQGSINKIIDNIEGQLVGKRGRDLNGNIIGGGGGSVHQAKKVKGQKGTQLEDFQRQNDYKIKKQQELIDRKANRNLELEKKLKSENIDNIDLKRTLNSANARSTDLTGKLDSANASNTDLTGKLDAANADLSKWYRQKWAAPAVGGAALTAGIGGTALANS